MTHPNPDDEWDDAVKKVMGELESGKLYRDQLAAMRRCGLDPDKPLTVEFTDGTKASVVPRDSIAHLQPKRGSKQKGGTP